MDNIQIPWKGWQLVGEIGQGAYGNVYEIKRIGYGFEEHCAMKVMHIPQNAGDIDLMRIHGMNDDAIVQTCNGYVFDVVKEYELMLGLKNVPNIVHVYDYEVIRNNDELLWTLYIRMELLTPIARSLDCVKTEAQILKLAKDVCSALVACHKHNILHRDVKIQNILIDSDGDFRLGDFGVSRIMEQTTQATAGVGSVDYMAPEVALGTEMYGQQADIYSLGIVLYSLLNMGRMPFLPLPPQRYTAAQAEECRRRRWRGEAVPKPVNGCREFQMVVMKACEADTQKRFFTAQNMLDVLNQIIIPAEEKDQELAGTVTKVDNDCEIPTIIDHISRDSGKGSQCRFEQQPDSQESEHHGGKNRWVMFLPIMLITIVVLFWSMVHGSNNESVLQGEGTQTLETAPDQQTVSTTGRNVLDRMFFKEICTEIEKECAARYGDPEFSLVGYRTSLKFYDSLKPAPSNAIDVSENNDGSVLAWWYINESDCEIYVAADKGVIAPENCRELFAGVTILHEINFNRSFITNNVTDMSYMFSQCTNLEHIVFSGFVTSNVTTMRWMFYSCWAIEKLDLSMFDTVKVTDMGKMFNACENLYDLNLDSFQMSNVTDKDGMFAGAHKVVVQDNICDHACIPAGYYDGRVWVEGFQCEECDAFFENDYSFYIDAAEMVPGKTFEYGIYEQDNDTSNGKEPIEWLVLTREGNEALVVSTLGLETLPYEASEESVDWENCSMRTWLEDTFYEEAFSDREKRSIAEKNIIQHKNKGYPNCDQGNNTIDHVFLLSAYEYSEYLYNNKAIDAKYREGVPSQYVLQKGIDKHDSYKGERCWWWLRTSSRYNEKACFVNALGPSEVYVGYPINKSGGMIRPAMWIALN